MLWGVGGGHAALSLARVPSAKQRTQALRFGFGLDQAAARLLRGGHADPADRPANERLPRLEATPRLHLADDGSADQMIGPENRQCCGDEPGTFSGDPLEQLGMA